MCKLASRVGHQGSLRTCLSRFSVAVIRQEIGIPVVSGMTADTEKSMSCMGFCAYCRVGARALLRANVAHRFQENCAFIEDIDEFQRQAAPSKPLSQFMVQVTFTGSRGKMMVVKVTFADRDTVRALVICAIASVLLRFLLKLPQSFSGPHGNGRIYLYSGATRRKFSPKVAWRCLVLDVSAALSCRESLGSTTRCRGDW